MYKNEDYIDYEAVVKVAIRKGLLVKPDNCSHCGRGGRIGGHHPDYRKPLYVIWLCESCHMCLHWDTISLPYLEKAEPTGFVSENNIIDEHEYFSEPIEWYKLFAQLTWRERKIIKLRYGFGNGRTYTLEEVGRNFKITRERVRQIEVKAIWKLRRMKSMLPVPMMRRPKNYSVNLLI